MATGRCRARTTSCRRPTSVGAHRSTSEDSFHRVRGKLSNGTTRGPAAKAWHGDLTDTRSWPMRHVGLVTALLLAAFTPVAAPPAAAQDAERALAIAREVERVAADRALWPGFDPLSIPLAIYAGGRTHLFRHPSPPEGFVLPPGAEPDVWVFEGRHPSVVASTGSAPAGRRRSRKTTRTTSTRCSGPLSMRARAMRAAVVSKPARRRRSNAPRGRTRPPWSRGARSAGMRSTRARA